MKITKNYNPWNEPIDRVWEVYAGIVSKPVSAVKEYLEDVKSLEGKLPDGEFERTPNKSEEAVLDGFVGTNFSTYLEELVDTVRERINVYLERDSFGESRGRVYTIVEEEVEYELKECRELAIAKTIEKLIPGLFILKTTRSERFIVNPTYAGKRR